MDFTGVDGCRAGWIWIGLNGDEWQFGICRNTPDLYEIILSSKLTLIDIPIGLMSSGNACRQCDQEARHLLKYPRASSVFNPPIREVLEAKNYTEACRINKKLTGKGLNYQFWNITAKIREIDQLLNNAPDIRNIIRESHPEICFWCLNDGKAMKHNKKTLLGRKERLAVLGKVFTKSEILINEIASETLRKNVAWDDIHDALVCALVAKNGYGKLRTIPDKPPIDSWGLPMEIVFL